MNQVRERQKAQDVFQERNNPFIEKSSSFEKAFPSIRSIKAKVEERGKGVDYNNQFSGKYKERIYGNNSVTEYINCSNPLCYNGGFSLGHLLRMAEDQKKRRVEEIISCQGYEGSPKGRKRYSSCGNYFSILIDIEYHE